MEQHVLYRVQVAQTMARKKCVRETFYGANVLNGSRLLGRIGGFVTNGRPRDRLAQFSNRLAQIKFIVFEIGMLIVFLVGLYSVVRKGPGFPRSVGESFLLRGRLFVLESDCRRVVSADCLSNRKFGG